MLSLCVDGKEERRKDTHMRADKSCVRCVRNDTWNNRTIYFLLFFYIFPFHFLFFLPPAHYTTFRTHSEVKLYIVRYTCVWPKDVVRIARKAINKIPLCNYVVTISTRGLLYYCCTWKVLKYCINNSWLTSMHIR